MRLDAQDPVVALARGAAAVAVAGRDVERAVGADHDVAQPAVNAAQDRAHVHELEIRVERELEQPLAAQRRHPQAVAEPGDARRRPRVALGFHERVRIAAALGVRAVGAGDVRPPVVPPALDVVDLVVCARTVLGGQEAAPAIPREALRVAVTERPHGRARKRIVGGDGAIRLEPQDLPVEAVTRLRQPRLPRVAHRRVELAVGPELQPAAVVDRSAAHAVEEHALLSRAAVAQREPHDAIDQVTLPRGRVADVEMAGVAEAGIEGQAHEAGLALRRDAQRGDGRGLEPPVLHDADAPDAFGHEQTTIGCERQRPGHLEPGRDGLDPGLGGRRRDRQRREHQRAGEPAQKNSIATMKSTTKAPAPT